MTVKASKHRDLDYSVLLVVIFALMLKDGVRAKDLLSVCARALEEAEAAAPLRQASEPGLFLRIGLVLDTWHRDRRYLTSRATPKPVRLLGRTPSVEALIRVQRGRKKPAHVAQLLKSLRLIVPCGRGLYKPTSDVALISRHNPVVLQQLAKSLSTLLETVEQNVNGGRRAGPLIERIAEVPDLPSKHVAAFQNFTQAQGRTFLRTVNDWLESRRARHSVRRGRRNTVRAGVHTYAYIA
jgi:hypothetical protein